jgi:hypothetical protein
MVSAAIEGTPIADQLPGRQSPTGKHRFDKTETLYHMHARPSVWVSQIRLQTIHQRMARLYRSRRQGACQRDHLLSNIVYGVKRIQGFVQCIEAVRSGDQAMLRR